jgi:hypothetical protein
LVENGRAALLLKDATATAETADSLYLGYAFVTQGPEEHILPAFVLDDWGHEIKSLQLYEWVAEHGDQFPRAEIFGFEPNGLATQCFLRQIELDSLLPCYAYRRQDTPLVEGLWLQAILLPDESVSAPQKTKRPPELKRPLSAAKVSWWRVNPAASQLGLMVLGVDMGRRPAQ